MNHVDVNSQFCGDQNQEKYTFAGKFYGEHLTRVAKSSWQDDRWEWGQMPDHWMEHLHRPIAKLLMYLTGYIRLIGFAA